MEVASEVQDNQTLGEIRDYKLLAKLGEGGMGAVYKALHTRLNKVVALKLLPPDKTRDAAALARFEREMQAVGRLQHPNIVAAHDAGEADGQHFLVMELVDGEDLSQIVKRHGPLDVADACEVVRQAAVGLQEAHEHGMVHRDIKPSNLMLAVRRRKKKTTAAVKILDMGLALLDERHADGGELTSTGQLMGTIDYMAPEQAADTHNVDIRADIYALGATLYKLLTGVAPLADKKYDSAVKKIIALVNEQPPSIGEKRPDLPAELIALVDALMAKQPDDRPAAPEDVAEALAPFCAGRHLAALAPERPGDAAADERVATVSLSAASVETAPTFLDSQAPTPHERTIDAPLGKPAKQPSSGRRRPPRKRLLIAAAAGAFFLLAAACGVLVLLVQTPDGGTLRIEIADPDIEVSIKGGEVLLQGVGKKDITFTPGKHVLHVKRGDFEFDTTSLQLKKNETIIVKVEWLAGGTLRATRDGKVIGMDSQPSATTAAPEDIPPIAVAPFSAEEAKRHQQAWADFLGRPVESTNSIGMKFTVIPPGDFMMGSSDEEIQKLIEEAKEQSEFFKVYSEWIPNEGPQHRVTLTKPFAMGVFEVTRGQFRQFVDATGYKTEAEKDGKGGYGYRSGKWMRSPEFLWNTTLGFDTEQTDDNPVVNVSWNDAVAFCKWLSQKEGVTYRLPTEAEWEFACRAGNPGRFCFGDDEQELEKYAWHNSLAGRNLMPVGFKSANAFGLFDMHGNVFEWCSDWLGPYPSRAVVDPQGIGDGTARRVWRGGAFFVSPMFARSAYRTGYPATFRDNNYGFRIVRALESDRH
ncbi:MAG: bifunctional serine/threonine-protein kinase/formylglycine-generating enzyme family protein [Pirellulaceae bacterium]